MPSGANIFLTYNFFVRFLLFVIKICHSARTKRRFTHLIVKTFCNIERYQWRNAPADKCPRAQTYYPLYWLHSHKTSSVFFSYLRKRQLPQKGEALIAELIYFSVWTTIWLNGIFMPFLSNIFFSSPFKARCTVNLSPSLHFTEK